MSIFKNIKYFATSFKGQAFKFLLLPFVLFGLYYVYNQHSSKGVETYAIDPLIVTYPGNPQNPMFTITNMLPGDFKFWILR